MNVGLFFGSFNPIHIGHLIIAQYLLDNTELKKIWFVLSPQNPLKKKNILLNEYLRLDLLKLAVDDNTKFYASDIEFNLSRPSFTADTLIYLKEKYPQNKFSIMMGSDCFQNLSNWKNHKFILGNYDIYVYKRKNFDVSSSRLKNVYIIDVPMFDISASTIRQYIKEKKSIQYLVPEKVRAEIIKFKYYTE